MKRVLPLLVAVCVLVGALAVPSMAAVPTIDYNEYITNIVVDGDNDLVTALLPSDNVSFGLFGYPSYRQIGGAGNPATFVMDVSTLNPGEYSYLVICNCFASDFLRVDNIPDGSILTWRISVDCSGPGYNTPNAWFLAWYVDENGNHIGDYSVRVDVQGTTNETIEITYQVTKPAGAVALDCRIDFDAMSPINPGAYQYAFTLDSLQLDMSISSLYRLNEQTGKTNQLLTAVEKQLQQNGQKLDSIINGDSGIDSGVTDFDSVGDDMQSAGNQANSAIGDGLGTLGDLAGSGAVTSTLAVLGGAIASVFVGNEVTLCGMTFNPFEVLVVVLGAVSLLGLFLAYIFRKRGGS